MDGLRPLQYAEATSSRAVGREGGAQSSIRLLRSKPIILVLNRKISSTGIRIHRASANHALAVVLSPEKTS